MNLTGETRLFFLVANPVEHVRTTARLSRYFDEKGIDAICVPLHVLPQDLSGFFEMARKMSNLGGLVVTIPHKQSIAVLCDELTGSAELIKTANVIRKDPGGRMIGNNTDGVGFVEGLKKNGLDPKGLRVYLAGAGGVSAAIGYDLIRAGISGLTIHNRTREKAAGLIELYERIDHPVELALGGDNPKGHDLIVNGTSLGMHDGDSPPFDFSALDPAMTVAEVIMAPVMTPLLIEAKTVGCKIIPGKEMNVPQIELLAEFLNVHAG
jgi:shikimate dehydrogenase